MTKAIGRIAISEDRTGRGDVFVDDVSFNEPVIIDWYNATFNFDEGEVLIVLATIKENPGRCDRTNSFWSYVLSSQRLGWISEL